MHKKDVIRLLETIAMYMELKGDNPFKISAFRKAAAALEQDDRSLSEIDDMMSLSGIGKGTYAVIKEYIDQGVSGTLERLKKEVPEGLIPLLKLPGLGGKKIAKLYQELGVSDMSSLKEACEEHKVQGLAGFGKKTEEKILQALGEVGKRPERYPIGIALAVAEEIEEQLNGLPGLIKFSRAGSLRRAKETVKDLDYMIAVTDHSLVREGLLNLSNVKEVIAAGDTKVSLLFQFESEISADFRLVTEDQFPTALHHFTGSKDHNIKMRQLAKEKGERISEYGVENIETGDIQTFSSEKEFFAHFGLPFIPPELRESGKEVEIYQDHLGLVSIEDIKGDLHMHSTWSDGAYSIREMAEACIAKGYQYMAITDHSQYLKVANGLTPERLRKQAKEIDKLNKEFTHFHIFKGVEMDILPDGTLDYDDELLAEMDLVIASIHSNFSQPQHVIMKRLEQALMNQHVDIIAHPTGRLIGRRAGYEVDIDQLIELAKKTNTALELNANPARLDLRMEHLLKANAAGVTLVINTDAHSKDMLYDMKTGVMAARKGWTQKANVLNARSLEEVRTFLSRHRS
ncbi:DNA polymerase/3'-5' exonuclease PolX [Bacillus sp. WMMC1349]|uniref:DNA polymerase/3'-5' exonuclease PolX n=1 Tax=Bacillus sp. WMMC1349 TaxID=2736254 RepID=UPI0015559D7D|nr:DNA polymerase/3'-5' exonuclease PolX [Bacillus sp. WMMC1349]NPC93664.1 DNA polymerase/3'-5' exonuclease PolX [Bacillus sp. WMMC1349]